MAGMEGRDEDFVGLAEVIRQVRRELTQARDDGDAAAADSAGGAPPLRFAVRQVNLEFAVQVRHTGDGRAGLRIGVLTADVGGSAARESTHRIQVELEPITEGGGEAVVGLP